MGRYKKKGWSPEARARQSVRMRERWGNKNGTTIMQDLAHIKECVASVERKLATV